MDILDYQPSPPRRELLRPPAVSVRPPGELQWNLYTDSEEYLNLSLLARTLDNVLTLRSDFMVCVCVVCVCVCECV